MCDTDMMRLTKQLYLIVREIRPISNYSLIIDHQTLSFNLVFVHNMVHKYYEMVNGTKRLSL